MALSSSAGYNVHLTPEQRASAKRVIFLTVFLDILGFGIIIPQLAVYASQFGATPLIVGILASTYSAMSFLSTPFWGRLSDRMGRRPILLYSIFGTGIGYIFFALANSLPLLFAARFIDGVTAGNISTAQAYLSDITPPEERSKTFGIFGAIFGVGFAIGPMVGALLAQLPAPWGGNFGIGLFTAALSFINWGLAVKRLPETLSPDVRAANNARHATTTADTAIANADGKAQASAAAKAAGARREIFNFRGFVRVFQLPGLNTIVWISFFSTLAFATLQGTYTLFLIKQYTRPEVQASIRRDPESAVKAARREIRDAKTAQPNLGAGEGGDDAVGDVVGGVDEPYPPSLGGDFTLEQPAPEGLSWRAVEKLLVRSRAATFAAWIFASIGVVALIVQGGLIGPLKNRFGEVNMVIAGTILMALGLALVPLPKHFAGEFPVMALLAFGNSIATPILTALVSELAPENERGELIGVYQSVGSLGRIFGPNIGGALFNSVSAGAPYFAGGAIMMIAFVFSLKLHGVQPEKTVETPTV